MKTITLNCALALLLFSCQSDNGSVDPINRICKHVEMTIPDPDDPINLSFDFDDNGRVTSLQGNSNGGEKLDLKLTYDSDGLIENFLSKDYEIKMDDLTKKVHSFTFGDPNSGPSFSMYFRNDTISSSSVINEDNEGVETEKYTYDDDGNTTTVKANVIDENGDPVGNYFVEFTYDKTHNAVFANAPFLQAYTTFSAYLLPFGLTNKNLISHMKITFSSDGNVAVESRDISYTFNDDEMVTSLSWSNKGGTFKTEFAYDCN